MIKSVRTLTPHGLTRNMVPHGCVRRIEVALSPVGTLTHTHIYIYL